MAEGKLVLMQKQRTKILLCLWLACMNRSHVFSHPSFHGVKIYRQLYYLTTLLKLVIIYSCMPPLKVAVLCVKITTDDRE